MEHGADNGLLALSAVLVLGIGAQWLAWRLRLPSILLLLLTGFVAGPVTGFLDPDKLLGWILFPSVSLAVGLILFEGGLGLRFRELRSIGGVVIKLVTVGALVTFALCAVAAHYILQLPWNTAILLGAVLVVTGPTVILPLLRFVRPTAEVGNILKWEGIVIDPIGATLSVLVFEAILAGELRGAGTLALHGALYTLLAGLGLGLLGALVLVIVLRRNLVPDYLQEAVTLMLVVAAFVGANLIQEEAGLLSATVMGVALANQRKVTTHHILRFKESLGVLLISSIFVLLAARIEIDQLRMLGWPAFAFVALLILVVRPAAVFVSTAGSKLGFKEKAFLADMAPRGIVAASVISVFAYKLEAAGIESASQLVPVVFLVIVVTVAVYGLTSTPLARILGLSQRNPQGVLFVGAHSWARELAIELKEAGFQVRLVDTNWSNIRAARMAGLPVWHGSILSHSTLDEVDLSGLGRLIALTPNDEANSLAALNFSELFGRHEVYQLPPAGLGQAKEGEDGFSPEHLRGRFLFGSGSNYSWLNQRFRMKTDFKTTKLSEEFGYEDFLKLHGESTLPLFLIDEHGRLRVMTVDNAPEPKAGLTLIALIDPPHDRESTSPPSTGAA